MPKRTTTKVQVIEVFDNGDERCEVRWPARAEGVDSPLKTGGMCATRSWCCEASPSKKDSCEVGRRRRGPSPRCRLEVGYRRGHSR